MKKNFLAILTFLAAGLGTLAQTAPKHLSIGDTIPKFSLPDQDGNVYNVADYLKKGAIVLFFYPKDDTPNSTRQAAGFKDHFKEFEEEGVTIVGINPGTVDKHKAFHQKNQFPFPLLSDKDSEVINKFGIKTTLGLTNRETYIVDYTGKIVFTLDSFADGTKHAEEALKYLKSQD